MVKPAPRKPYIEQRRQARLPEILRPRRLFLAAVASRSREIEVALRVQNLKVKLRGRTEARALGAEGAQFLSARGAKQEAHHGPLQRSLGGTSRRCYTKSAT